MAGIPVALAVNAFATRLRGGLRTSPPFTLQATPSVRRITPGETVRYRITIRRASSFRQPVSLMTLGGLPSGSRTSFTPQTTRGSSSTLSVTTASTKAGRYRPRVRAVSGRAQSTLTLTLVLSLPPSPPFVIGGSVGDLHPGSPGALNLALTNPSARNLGLTALTVGFQRVSAPNASATLPCTSGDFSIRQFSGSFPLVIPPSSTRTLAQLGVPAAQWPQVTLVDRPVNQDGCQGASLTLTYRGSGLYG